MTEDETWHECDDGTRLLLRRWTPKVRPVAVVQIVHGMAEHSLRYRRFAAKLCEAGIAVRAADMRGHGLTAASGGNDPGCGGLLGHCHDRSGAADGFDRVTADVRSIDAALSAELPGVPRFLLGHSWGSFVAQNIIEDGDRGLAGCVLSGTRGSAGAKAAFGAAFLTALAQIRGERRGSPLARTLADGPYRRAFLPARTPFDWLSRDADEVDAFVADPLCGQLCSVGFYRDMARALARIHRPRAMTGIRKSLPILIVCGSADPMGDMGASPAALAAAYRSHGIADVTLALYEGARHEPLNETVRDKATADIAAWILRLCQGHGEPLVE